MEKINLDEIIEAALRGDKQAQADCTAAGVLLPCPFCGGEAKLHESFKIIPVIDENGAYVDADIENSPSWVYCTACNAAGQEFDVDENDEENAIDAWNRRAQPANDPLTKYEIGVVRRLASDGLSDEQILQALKEM